VRARLRSVRNWHVAAWLGALALGFQAYIPIHLTHDIVHAVNDVLAPADGRGFVNQTQTADEESRHSHKDGGRGDPRHGDCAIFMAAPGASAFVLPAIVEVRQPERPVGSHVPWFAAPVLRTSCPASYASRAPPAIG
jgi:hypothetical protein